MKFTLNNYLGIYYFLVGFFPHYNSLSFLVFIIIIIIILFFYLLHNIHRAKETCWLVPTTMN